MRSGNEIVYSYSMILKIDFCSFSLLFYGKPIMQFFPILRVFLLAVFGSVLTSTVLIAQIGLNTPTGVSLTRDMEIYSRNSFLVQQKYTVTSSPPAGPIPMNCNTSLPELTDKAGVLLDPGGVNSYPANLTCIQVIANLSNSESDGFEITFLSFDTEADGDSVIIEDVYGSRIAFSGSSLPPVLLLSGHLITVTFKSDRDSNVGAGFALRWRQVSVDASAATGSERFNNSLQFDLNKGALVGGFPRLGALQLSGKGSTALGALNLASGDYSTALGTYNTAKGENSSVAGYMNTAIGNTSTALGYQNTATGNYATALGSANAANGLQTSALGAANRVTGNGGTALGIGNVVSGYFANALGYGNIANGNVAMAIGYQNVASGEGANAIGLNTTSSGPRSTAIGNYVSTAGYSGAMILGDISNSTSASATANNQFSARFAGGYRLFTSSDLTTGVTLSAGATSWATLSDSTKKEMFLPLNHAQLLSDINALRLGTWNYKGQPGRRHYGPMAQEFFARFGHDARGAIGCDTLIESHDFTAVTLAGVQALIQENEQLKSRVRQLEQQAQHLKADLTERLEALEALLPARRRGSDSGSR